MSIYRSFEQWTSGGFLEHGAPRTKEYTAEELHLVEMGWNYGYDAGRSVEQALNKMADNARELGLDYELPKQDVPETNFGNMAAQPAVQEGRDWSLLEATQESLREHMAEIKRLQKEIIEQCRIIAMGAEREDSLRAEIKRLKAAQPGVK
jgi:hypothetical protein